MWVTSSRLLKHLPNLQSSILAGAQRACCLLAERRLKAWATSSETTLIPRHFSPNLQSSIAAPLPLSHSARVRGPRPALGICFYGGIVCEAPTNTARNASNSSLCGEGSGKTRVAATRGGVQLGATSPSGAPAWGMRFIAERSEA